MVCLGEVELGSGADFGGDLALAGGRKPLLEHVARRLGFALLRFASGVASAFDTQDTNDSINPKTVIGWTTQSTRTFVSGATRESCLKL